MILVCVKCEWNVICERIFDFVIFVIKCFGVHIGISLILKLPKNSKLKTTFFMHFWFHKFWWILKIFDNLNQFDSFIFDNCFAAHLDLLLKV